MAVQYIEIDDLRPTQLTLGLSAVKRRMDKLGGMSAAEFHAYLVRKEVPHVLGPGGSTYLLDHHHLARALWDTGRTKMVLGPRIGDFSALNGKAFWHRMEAERYCWPIDADGNRRPYAAIPRHVRDLTDNVWRSLARSVRGRAFDDLDTPFQEFMWGDYFRTFMSRRLIEARFDLAAALAVDLAALPEAEDLPGFRAGG